MKRASSFLLPIVALLLVGGIISYKWWNATLSGLHPSPLPTSEGIKIEDGGRTLLKNFGMKETGSELKNVSKENAVAVVQWSDDKKSFTVIANVEEVAGTQVQAWLQNSDDSLTKLGTLRKEKAGFILDYKPKAAWDKPMTLVISREKKNDNVMEEKLLEGEVGAQ